MTKLTGEAITDEQCKIFASYLSKEVLDVALSEPRDEIEAARRLGARTLCAAVGNNCYGAMRDQRQPHPSVTGSDMEHRSGGFFLSDDLTFFIASGGELDTGRDVYLRVLAQEVLWLRSKIG
jgi:hypothetical protein